MTSTRSPPNRPQSSLRNSRQRSPPAAPRSVTSTSPATPAPAEAQASARCSRRSRMRAESGEGSPQPPPHCGDALQDEAPQRTQANSVSPSTAETRYAQPSQCFPVTVTVIPKEEAGSRGGAEARGVSQARHASSFFRRLPGLDPGSRCLSIGSTVTVFLDQKCIKGGFGRVLLLKTQIRK